jgi:hypothetical protein
MNIISQSSRLFSFLISKHVRTITGIIQERIAIFQSDKRSNPKIIQAKGLPPKIEEILFK